MSGGTKKDQGTQLLTTVHVEDENGEFQAFGPGDELPEWAEKKITWPADRDDLWVPAPKAAAADAKK